ncbi:MAG: methyltransferase domain-containing protein [Candidatus Aenigmarchaeota archaeon]|nr:methyltransferase domain-containing protein [Candidatus Aenigmarchaeota archaeon]
MAKITNNSLILLLGKKNYLVRPIKFSCEFGTTDLRKLVGKKFGRKIKIGKEGFTVVEPNVTDFLRKAKRGPQIILPKDLGLIVSVTGCSPGWKTVDAGTGSGFLTLFLGNLGCRVYSYEKEKRFFNIAKKNLKNYGLKNVVIRNSDITKGIKEKNVDLVTLDMKNPEKVIKHAFKSLKLGGWIAIYSMHIEEVKKVFKELKKYDFTNLKIVENLNREWQSIKQFTRPKTYMLAHTGFLTFGRKM